MIVRKQLGSARLVAAVLMSAAAAAGAAELSVGSLSMPPGSTATVVVSGAIADESTFGVTVMLELVPRSDAVGSLTFTPAPQPVWVPPLILIQGGPDAMEMVEVASLVPALTDIMQLGDAWPVGGTFSPFDTGGAGSVVLNGAVDDNGTFVPAPVTFFGPLAGFPVRASAQASGTWDVVLSTFKGDSSWEGVDTTLVAGVVHVSIDACVEDEECDDVDPCTVDVCEAGQCVHLPREGCGAGLDDVDDVPEDGVTSDEIGAQ